MLVRFRLPSGLEVFGLPTKNAYGGHWDLGPTWNYAVMTDRPFLVDAGKFGQGHRLLAVGVAAAIAVLLGVDGVCIISHGSSGETAIANGIGVARDMVEHDMVGAIRTAIADNVS